MSFLTLVPPTPAVSEDAKPPETGSPRLGNSPANSLGNNPRNGSAAPAPADFAAYVAQRRGALLRTAHQVAGDRTEAEDLLQEGLLKTYQAWHRIEDKAVVGSYLRRTMTNHQISQWRKRRVEEYPTDELPEHGYDGESMAQVEMRVTVGRALMKLSARDREALSLRYYGSYTDTEIAERMGVSVGTVKSALWRALRKLRDDPALRPLSVYVTAKGEQYTDAQAA